MRPPLPLPSLLPSRVDHAPTMVTLAVTLATTVGCARPPVAPGPAPPGGPAPAVWTIPSCPGLPAAPAALVQRAYQPVLFGRGQDASAQPDCLAPGNPERGFFAFRDLLAADLDLGSLRDQGVSLVYGKVLLADQRDRPLDAALLGRLTRAFTAIRLAGLKVLPRFYYAADEKAPDATNPRALEHIAALAPVLSANADVIAALHAGFLGAWGEWHPEDRASAADRRRILEALLAALPATRSVLVRRPHWKQTLFAGPGGAVGAGQVAGGSPLARLGHLNDCFLASDDDRGTYRSPGEEEYAARDSAQVAVGGETCGAHPPRSECPSALAALARHHWSFLNRDYHPDVLASWRQGGCLPTVACRLGYRLVLRGFTLPAQVRAGGPLPMALAIINDGFARPVNPRPLQLALTPTSHPTAPPILLPTPLDARTFAPQVPGTSSNQVPGTSSNQVPGTSSGCLAVMLPAGVVAGEYRVGVALLDPEASLAGDPRYAIRLGGDVRFDPATGINWLDVTVTITQ